MTSACSSGPKTETQARSSEPETPVVVQSSDSEIMISASSGKAPDGSIVLVNLSGKEVLGLKNVKVVFEGVEFHTYPTKSNPPVLQSVVVIPFNTKPRSSKIEVSWKQGNKLANQTLPIEVIDGNYRSEVLTVDQAHVDPPKKELKRILREQKEIGRLYWASESTRYWNGPFIWPIKSDLTSPFGNKRVYNGQMKSFHQGLDLRAPVGTPIMAGGTGKVVLAKDLYFTGNTVIMDHGLGLFTIYAHMSKLNVKKGQIVSQGQLIGLAGATGRASGPHLHWGAVLQRLKFNPENLIRVLDKTDSPSPELSGNVRGRLRRLRNVSLVSP